MAISASPPRRNRVVRGYQNASGFSRAVGESGERLLEVGPEVLDVLDPDAQAQQRRRRAHRHLARPARAALDQRLDPAEAGRVGDQPHARAPRPRRRPRRRSSRTRAWRRSRPSGAPRGRGRDRRAGRGSGPARRRGGRRGGGRARRPSPARAPGARRACAGRAGRGRRPSARAPRRRRRAARSSAAASSWSAVTAAPISRSACPPRYFVTLCTTTSAPSSSGRCSSGVAKVLSTAVRTPRMRAPVEQHGQVGDVHQRVGGRLQPQQRGALAGGQRRLGVRDVDRDRDEPPGRHAVVEHLVHAPVEAVREDDPRAAGQRLQHRGDRGQAGGEGRRSGRPPAGRAPPRTRPASGRPSGRTCALRRRGRSS